MKMDNRRQGIKLLALFLSSSAVFLLGHGCGGGGGGSDSDTPTPPTKSVVITGTVPGTVAIAYDYATGMEAAQDGAGRTGLHPPIDRCASISTVGKGLGGEFKPLR
jgi:hypothetical protein